MACYHMGELFSSGAQGLILDHCRAFHYFLRSAQRGLSQGHYRTALCYGVGVGVGRCDEQAWTHMRQAAEQGHPEAAAYMRAFAAEVREGGNRPFRELESECEQGEATRSSLPHSDSLNLQSLCRALAEGTASAS